MNSEEKIIQQFLTQPESMKYDKIETILIKIGFLKSQGKGSHVKFFHTDCRERIVLPVHNNDCKRLYKVRTLKILKNNNLI